MATSGKHKVKRRMPKIVRIAHARPKLVTSILFGALTASLLPWDLGGIMRALIGWDACVLLYLIIVFWHITRSEISHIRERAAAEDEGRVAVLVLTVGATLASLAAIIVLLGQAAGKNEMPQLVFASATVVLSWVFIHAIFATHYAHDFYGELPAASGLRFPGDNKPDYLDFVYFSFVIGMTFQVSDVAVTARSIRRTVLAHAIVSFFFNVALLAIMINIAANAI
jgi:uncharacterized membrane protein